MSKEEKAIYLSGGIIAVMTAVGLVSIAWVINNRVRRVESSVNALPDRLVKSLRVAVGI